MKNKIKKIISLSLTSIMILGSFAPVFAIKPTIEYT